jgi:hypothetical protein
MFWKAIRHVLCVHYPLANRVSQDVKNARTHANDTIAFTIDELLGSLPPSKNLALVSSIPPYTPLAITVARHIPIKMTKFIMTLKFVSFSILMVCFLR